MIRRLTVYLGAIVVGLLTGLFSQAAAEAHAPSGQPVAIYAYDSPHVPAVDVSSTSERGPPTSHLDVRLRQADAQGGGPLAPRAHATTYDYDAYLEPALTDSAKIYDRKVRLSEVGAVGTTGLSLQPSGVAAETGAPLIKAGSEGGETVGKAFSQRVRQQALDENPNFCVYCRMETDRPQVDHVIPRSQGGNATLENAQTTCWFCNASKGARDFPVNPPPGFEGLFPPSWWEIL